MTELQQILKTLKDIERRLAALEVPPDDVRALDMPAVLWEPDWGKGTTADLVRSLRTRVTCVDYS